MGRAVSLRGISEASTVASDRRLPLHPCAPGIQGALAVVQQLGAPIEQQVLRWPGVNLDRFWR